MRAVLKATVIEFDACFMEFRLTFGFPSVCDDVIFVETNELYPVAETIEQNLKQNVCILRNCGIELVVQRNTLTIYIYSICKDIA